MRNDEAKAEPLMEGAIHVHSQHRRTKGLENMDNMMSFCETQHHAALPADAVTYAGATSLRERKAAREEKSAYLASLWLSELARDCSR